MGRRSLAILLTVLLLAGLAATAAAEGTPEERMAAYHQAILDGDIDAASSMLGEDLVLFEDGIAEKSKGDYVKGHLKADIEFSAKAKRKLLSQTSWIEGDTATIASSYDFKTKYKRASYHITSLETATLKMRDGKWVIVHVHWSNHRLKK